MLVVFHLIALPLGLGIGLPLFRRRRGSGVAPVIPANALTHTGEYLSHEGEYPRQP